MLHTTLEDVDSIYTVYIIINILIILCLLGLIGTLMIGVRMTFLKIMASAISSFIILIGVLDILHPSLVKKKGVSTVVTKTNTLYLDDYTLVKNDSKYLIISRQTGMVNEIGEDSYMRYELCYQIELVKFDYIKKLQGLIISVDAPGTGYRIDCFSE